MLYRTKDFHEKKQRKKGSQLLNSVGFYLNLQLK